MAKKAHLSDEAQEQAFVKKEVEEEIVEKEASTPKEDMIEVVLENILAPGHPIIGGHGTTKNHQTYNYLDGGKYWMTKERARHIRGLKVPRYELLPDGSGERVKKLVGYDHRFGVTQAF